MGTLSLGSRISEKLPKVTTTLGALCRPGLAVWYTSVSLCGSVRLVSYAVSNSGVVCAPTQQSQMGRHCLRWYSRHFDRLVLAGNDIVDFQWGKKDEWLSWEAVLYALVWMRMELIEHELVFEEALYKKPFPYVDAKGESDKLECVVQLMRSSCIQPTWSSTLRDMIPTFPPNTKMHFTARALADHLRKVSRKNAPGWRKYSINSNPRILAGKDKWWPLVANPTCRSYLLTKLKTYMISTIIERISSEFYNGTCDPIAIETLIQKLQDDDWLSLRCRHNIDFLINVQDRLREEGIDFDPMSLMWDVEGEVEAMPDYDLEPRLFTEPDE
jgi:hypothetical protein